MSEQQNRKFQAIVILIFAFIVTAIMQNI
jgi:hypothetical protein